jgi:hypothetical protein
MAQSPEGMIPICRNYECEYNGLCESGKWNVEVIDGKEITTVTLDPGKYLFTGGKFYRIDN